MTLRTKLSQDEMLSVESWILRNYIKVCEWDAHFYAQRVIRLTLGDKDEKLVLSKLHELTQLYGETDDVTLNRLTNDLLLYKRDRIKRDSEVMKCLSWQNEAIMDMLTAQGIEQCRFVS